jgi:hypothetical protein
MRSLRNARPVLAVCVLFAFSFMPEFGSADVTVNQQGYNHGKKKVEWTKRIQIKALKMRVEFQKGSENEILLYDLDAGKRYRFDLKKQVAYELDLTTTRETWKTQIDPKAVRRLIQSTGKKASINGVSCDEYTFDLQAPIHFDIGATGIQRDYGTVCVSQDLPQGIEFTKFVHEAIARGFYAPAGICSPTQAGIGHFFYGDQPNVMVLSAETISDFRFNTSGIPTQHLVETNMDVVSVDSNPITEETFRIPKDWKVKSE